MSTGIDTKKSSVSLIHCIKISEAIEYVDIAHVVNISNPVIQNKGYDFGTDVEKGRKI